MNQEIIIRSFQLGEEEGLVEFLQEVFNVWPNFKLDCTSLDHWKWKYIDHPFRMNLIALAENDNVIVGANHRFFQKIKILDNVLICSHGVDNAVHPNFRNRGISKKLYELCTKMGRGINIRYNSYRTRNPLIVKYSLSRPDTNPIFPFQVEYLERPSETTDNVKSITISKTLTIKDVQLFDERINDFWNNISASYDFILERDNKYLTWRYCDPRGGNYIIKQVEENDEILGYIILACARKKGYIVDLLALPWRIDAAHVLIMEALKCLENNKVNIIYYQVARGHPYDKILREYGFIESKEKFHFFYEPLGNEKELDKLKNTTPDKIHLVYGDSDHI